ncbi:MAG: hypothetical protein A2Y65_03325 [Deltaproteobacteria bacterium RBG_13_52_11]|nr:MAG: hypothetical protein A2Y65_03325 [Deltaproteobacteria bacterium RBG_13_52_11]
MRVGNASDSPTTSTQEASQSELAEYRAPNCSISRASCWLSLFPVPRVTISAVMSANPSFPAGSLSLPLLTITVIWASGSL